MTMTPIPPQSGTAVVTNITPLFKKSDPEILMGPFEYYKVVIDGRVIPLLEAHKLNDEKVNLVLDGRFAAACDAADLPQFASLVANALAIGMGYSCLGAESKARPFAPVAMHIGSIETEGNSP